MVAEDTISGKSTVEHNVIEEFTNGLNICNVSQCNSEASSDDSLKSRKDNHGDQSVDTSAKDESNDENIKLNKTYLCLASNAGGDFNTNPDLDTDEQSKDILMSTDLTSSSLAKSTPRKRRNIFSLTSAYDEWNSELHSKIENLTINQSSLEDVYNGESLLIRLRNYLAEYQESQGISREEYTFSTLMKVMGQAIARCLFALFYVFLNIMPVLEVFIYILRFSVDKLIDIKSTSDFQQGFMKIVLFSLQLISIYIIGLIFIFGLFVSPLIQMAFGIISKIMLYD